MSGDVDEGQRFADCRAVRETDKGLEVEVPGVGTLWVPKRGIHDDSEVFDMDHAEGELVLHQWCVDLKKKEGLL